MEVLIAFQIVLAYISSCVIAETNFLSSILLPPIRQPTIFNKISFTTSQVQRDTNSNKIHQNFYHEHGLQNPNYPLIGQNDWTPINDPRIFDNIDLRSGRIVFVGSQHQNTNKNPVSENINRVIPRFESKTLTLPFIQGENLSNEKSVVVRSFYTLNPQKTENIPKNGAPEKPQNKVNQFKTSSAVQSATSVSESDNQQTFEGHRKLQKKLEANLANVLKEFEGNISRILETAVGNVSTTTRKLSSRQLIGQYVTTGADNKETGSHQTTGEIYPLPRPIQSNPSISGPPSFALIGRLVPPLADTGYISPPILNLNSNGHGNGTFHYSAEDGYAAQGTPEAATEAEPGVIFQGPRGSIAGSGRSNIPSIASKTNKARLSLQVPVYTSRYSNFLTTNERNEPYKKELRASSNNISKSLNDRDTSKSVENTLTKLENALIEAKFDSKRINAADFSSKSKENGIEFDIVKRTPNRHFEEIQIEHEAKKTTKQDYEEDNRAEAESRIRNNRFAKGLPIQIEHEDKKAMKTKRDYEVEEVDTAEAESTIRNNRVAKGLPIRHTSIDFKGLSSFNPGYNSVDHLPPDPYVALLLSHYGRYLPAGNVLTTQYRNLYSYLAANNIHNNKPFGAYKIYEDADG